MTALNSPLKVVAPVLAVALLAWGAEFVSILSTVRNEAAVAHAAGLSMTTLAGPRELKALGTPGKDYDVARDGTVILRAGSHLYELPRGSLPFFDEGLKQAPDSVALDRRDVVLAVSHGFLGTLSTRDNSAQSGVPLPYPNARLAPSVNQGAVYLFGGTGRDYRLYRFFEDGAYQVLLSSDRAIAAVADSLHAVYAATPTTIVQITGPRPLILFKAPDDPNWGPIISVAAADDGLVFFSTPRKIYALKGGIALSIVNDSGGALRLRSNRLYVLDARRDLLFALEPASLSIFRGGNS